MDFQQTSRFDANAWKKKGRGPTYLTHLEKYRKRGKKLAVEYNSKGQPVGKVATLLSSYTGLLARTMVPITYEHWGKVPSNLKEKIWIRVKKLFQMEERMKAKILSSTSSKWRNFKSKLSTIYIVPFKDEPDTLKHPPSKYDFIQQMHWETFVRTRLSEEFMKLSQIQKQRRAKHVYTHRLSRRGYVGLEFELKRSSGSNDDIDRSILWKTGRVNKKGEYTNEAVKGRAEKIDELMQQIKEGIISPDGSEDVLTMALETPEKGSRVRGVGSFVTPKSYFGKSTERNLSSEEMKVVKERVVFFEETMEKLLQELKSMKEVDQTGQARRDHSETIEKLLQEIRRMKEMNPPIQTPNNSEKISSQKDSDCSTEDSSSASLQKDSLKELSHLIKEDDYMLPSSVKSLRRYADQLMGENGAIRIQMESGIVENESGCFYLMRDDILQFCRMEEIAVTTILTYIRILFDELKNCHMEDMYKFVDPSIFSERSGYSYEYRARALTSRMLIIKQQELLLLPYNVQRHWVLVVVDPHDCVVSFLDPLGNEPYQDLKNFIPLALKMFIKQVGKKGQRGLTWKKIKCPRQPTNIECGYYVMSYMKDIVTNRSVPISHLFKERDAYTQVEIDEVRSEWANFILKFC